MNIPRMRFQRAVYYLWELWRTIPYGERWSDRWTLFWYACVRTLLSPVLLLTALLHRKTCVSLSDALFRLLPAIYIVAPYGRYVSRARTDDIGSLTPSFDTVFTKKLLADARGVCIDVGANIGRYTVMLGRERPDVTIIAIEPGAETFQALLRNIRLNRVKNVIPLNCACTARNGLFPMYSQGKIHSPGATLHSQIPRQHQWPAVNVSTVVGERLDAILLKQHIPFHKVGMVKIDVEGGEAVVLRGATQLLHRGNARILFEAWNEDKYHEATTLLRKFGYTVRSISPGNYFAEKKVKE